MRKIATRLQQEYLTIAGILLISGGFGYYAHEFAFLTQANMFFSDWGFF